MFNQSVFHNVSQEIQNTFVKYIYSNVVDINSVECFRNNNSLHQAKYCQRTVIIQHKPQPNTT